MDGSSLGIYEGTPDGSMLGPSDSEGLLDALLIGLGEFETLGSKDLDCSIDGPWLGKCDIKVVSSLGLGDKEGLLDGVSLGSGERLLEGT